MLCARFINIEKKKNGTGVATFDIIKFVDPSTVTNGVGLKIVKLVFAFGPLPTIKFLIRLSKGKGLDPPGLKFQSCVFLKQ